MTEVWVTGIGAWSAAGAGVAALSEAVAGARSCVAPVAPLATRWIGRAPDPPPHPARRRLDRAAAFFHVAALEGWRAADLEGRECDPDRVAVIDGSSLGPVGATADLARRLERDPDARPTPSSIIRLLPGAGADVVAATIGARDAAQTIVAGSASGAIAIIEGYHRILADRSDVVLVGGADAALDPGVLATFASAGILAPDAPELPCRPFDLHRCGTVLGEGGAALVLESARHARRRGAEPLAVIAGVGTSGDDGWSPTPDPCGAGTRRAVLRAIADSGLTPSWIKAHGTGTRPSDAAECHAMRTLLGHAPITSLKPLLGHTLGASGALEAVASVLALAAGVLPATMGTRTVDPALGPCRVPLQPEPLSADSAILLSASLGGRTAALLIRRGIPIHH